MKKKLLFLLLALQLATGFTQTTTTFHNCREAIEAVLLTSPYVKTLVAPWDKQPAQIGKGWDYVLESSPVFKDNDPMSGNAFSEDYVFLLRQLSAGSAVPAYTFKVKPSNGKLYQLDSTSNNWIQRKSDTSLVKVIKSLCK
jgi:hypothetical protein